MTLYVIDGQGFFDADRIALPATVAVMPAPHRVTLDGTPLRLLGARVELPSTLPSGMHTLQLDGVAVPIKVEGGQLIARQGDWRCLLPTVVRLLRLEQTLAEMKKAAEENQVDWLK